MYDHDRYAYCPCCGRPYALGAFQPNGGYLQCDACGYRFYQNAKPSCAAIIPEPFNPSKVLFLTRATPPQVGKIALPGGFLELGETPEEAVVREVREETDLEVAVVDLLCVTLLKNEYLGAELKAMEIAFVVQPGEFRTIGPSTSEASHLGFYSVEKILLDQSALAFPEHAGVLRKYQGYRCR